MCTFRSLNIEAIAQSWLMNVSGKFYFFSIINFKFINAYLKIFSEAHELVFTSEFYFWCENIFFQTLYNLVQPFSLMTWIYFCFWLTQDLSRQLWALLDVTNPKNRHIDIKQVYLKDPISQNILGKKKKLVKCR